MKSIVLIGMMGTGKSTIGKYLAEKLNLKFIDIDSTIEKFQQMSIAQIFETKGEEYFRDIEREYIMNTFENNSVIALGGGAYEDKETRRFLMNSLIIHLKTSPNIIYERIKNDKTRPLLKDQMTVEKIAQIYNSRAINYEKANITITTDNKTPKEIVKEIMEAIE
ncbi:shikimate kinase [bacterium]|nr:shikimate kinase [bacterium]